MATTITMEEASAAAIAARSGDLPSTATSSRNEESWSPNRAETANGLSKQAMLGPKTSVKMTKSVYIEGMKKQGGNM